MGGQDDCDWLKEGSALSFNEVNRLNKIIQSFNCVVSETLSGVAASFSGFLYN